MALGTFLCFLSLNFFSFIEVKLTNKIVRYVKYEIVIWYMNMLWKDSPV